MEVIEFINDIKKMGSVYFNIWLPIVLQFRKEETVTVKLNVPLDVPSSTYYRIINYGISVFPKYVKAHSLSKNHSQIILSNNDKNHVQNIPKIAHSKELIKPNIQSETIELETIQSEVIHAEIILEKPKAPRKKATLASYPNEVYEDIVSFLNETTGKNYKTNSVINRKFITQRLNDGFTVDDFKQVIIVKSTNWLGGKMEQFLRPETLFSNKFEAYLNENVVSNMPKSNLKNTYDQVNLATEFYNSQE